MSVAQALALRFEVAHAAKNCEDQATKVRMLLKMAALDEKIKAGLYAPPKEKKRK